ncbi:DUF1569 domain-containing protein [Runella sp.]|uniref:DUF1569 domain-containing protein n=1 Tax=Runella sp. TaxID=1960881 RepID=UPI00301A1843
MQYQKVTSTDFFNSTSYASIMERLDHIQPNSERQWGSMTVAQMLHHLSLAIGSGLGYYNLPDTSNVITRTVNQFLILDVLKRFPMGTKTAPPLKVASDDFDFETEKTQLKEILTKAYQTQTDEAWGKHTYFGNMSRKDWGKLIMIHCNHHFQQFSN